MVKIKSFLLAFSIVLLSQCEDQIVSECKTGETVVMPARFSAIQERVFTPICVECHSGSVPTGNLRLSAGNAYSQLIDKQIVIPGNSESSILFSRLTSDDPNFYMPPTGKLSQVLIDSIAAWIDKGAPND